MKIKHAPGETGPECDAVGWTFPRDFAVTADDEVTCQACLDVIAKRKEGETTA